jgi:hypothetical protein
MENPMQPTQLYIIEAANGTLKFGVSSDPKRRLFELQQPSALELSLRSTIHVPSDERAFALLHLLRVRYDAYRAHGDWYRVKYKQVQGDLVWALQTTNLLLTSSVVEHDAKPVQNFLNLLAKRIGGNNNDGK